MGRQLRPREEPQKGCRGWKGYLTVSSATSSCVGQQQGLAACPGTLLGSSHHPSAPPDPAEGHIHVSASPQHERCSCPAWPLGCSSAQEELGAAPTKGTALPSSPSKGWVLLLLNPWFQRMARCVWAYMSTQTGGCWGRVRAAHPIPVGGRGVIKDAGQVAIGRIQERYKT